jgi:hypothetical protein
VKPTTPQGSDQANVLLLVVTAWLQFGSTGYQLEHPATEIFDWLAGRLRGRAEHGILPIGMPESFEGLSVTTSKDGKAGHIRFALLDNTAAHLSDMPCRGQIEYEYGYTYLGIGDAYSLRMLAQEFWALTRNDWSLYPTTSHSRHVDGTICHGTTKNSKSFHESPTVDVIDKQPVKIQVDVGRGTFINAVDDQASLLRYWAWARQTIAVGVALPVDNHVIEYWFDFVLDPLPDDEEGRVYAEVLRQMWMNKLCE